MVERRFEIVIPIAVEWDPKDSEEDLIDYLNDIAYDLISASLRDEEEKIWSLRDTDVETWVLKNIKTGYESLP